MLKKIFFLLLSFPSRAQIVYKTPFGAKYRLSTCRMVKNISEKLTVAQAVKIGLQPCKICHPQAAARQAVSTNKAQEQNVTVQCKGLTKAGNRCRHMTSIANGYFYQYQPK